MQVSNKRLVLHLTEHHGDCCPGSKIRVQVSDIDAFQKQLSEKGYKYNNPGITLSDWNTKEVTVNDPFGNTICFFEPKE